MSDQQTFVSSLLEEFHRHSIYKTIEKGDFLLREGQTEKSLYFIESGAVRILMLTEFEEQTIRLGYRNTYINSLSSFINQQPSQFYIEALRKTQVKIISKKAIDELVYKNAEMGKAYIALLEDLVTQQIEREIDILTSSPKIRMERVLERSPHLFQEVPHKYIASYLRMTPETLSRLLNS